MVSVTLVQSKPIALDVHGLLSVAVSEELKSIQEIFSSIENNGILFDQELKIAAVKLTGGAHSATMAVTEFVVPGIFLVKENDLIRLRRASEVEADLKAIAAAAAKQATAALKERALHAITLIRHEHVKLVSTFGKIDVDLTAEGFFGISSVGGAGKARATLSLDAGALFDLLETGSTHKTLLTGLFQGELVAANPAFTARGALDLVVIVKLENVGAPLSDDLIQLLPSLSLPWVNGIAFPKLPIPAVQIPDFRIPNFEFGPLDGLLDFAFRSPFPGGSPNIRVDWDDPGLKIVAEVSSGILSAKTIQSGSGTILYDGEDLGRVDGFSVKLDDNGLAVLGKISPKAVGYSKDIALYPNLVPDAFPFGVELPQLRLGVDLAAVTVDLANPASPRFDARATIDIARLVIRAKEDPGISLALAATYTVTVDADGKPRGNLTRLEILEPYPVRLVVAAAEAALDGVIRLGAVLKLAQSFDLPGIVSPDVGPIIDRIGQLLLAALKWLARQVASTGNLLAGLAEDMLAGLASIFDILRQAADKALSHVAIDVRLDSQTFALRQILIAPVNGGQAFSGVAKSISLGGFSLTVPGSWKPSLLLDFSGPFLAALVVQPDDTELKLSTDLWLERPGAPAEAVRGAGLENKTGEVPKSPDPLITVHASGKEPLNIALICFDEKAVQLFQVLDTVPAEHVMDVGGKKVSVSAIADRPKLRPVNAGDGNDVNIKVQFGEGASEALPRYLPFFGSPDTETSGSGNPLSQFVTVENGSTASVAGAVVTLPVDVAIHLDGMKIAAAMSLIFDLATLSARVSGGDSIVLRRKRQTGNLFGLVYDIKSKSAGDVAADGTFPQFRLDLSGGNPRLVLHEKAEVELTYARLGTDGRGLTFKVSEFAVAKNSFDVIAAVDGEKPVTLPGVNMPFRFSGGSLVIKRGKIESFSLAGSGQLPPELVGEANCRIMLMLGRGDDGNLAVLSADAELDKSDEPIVCHGTRFTLSISKLGFAFEDFRNEGGYQFYFLVTGTVAFTPKGSEFASTFLKNLRNAKMTLNKAPLGRDMRLLLRAIDLQVALDPKVNINLFDIFGFELRSFGFNPAAEAFDGSPALSIGGQARFMDAGDVVSAKVDFHKMWIAPPKTGAMPRVRFDGLSVAVSLKGAGTIEGTAITVDDQLPSLYKPDTLPSGISAQGFLASGHLRLQGWGSMSAAMGFLELKGNDAQKRHSFFLYGQAEELSEPIPTPIKEIYLREVGFGFGYRYTLAGLRRADGVSTPQELVEVLDDVSKYQNDLAKFAAWEPEAEGDRITLALRGMLSVNSASSNGSLSDAEEKLANPLLFDVAAALRSDLTFLMTARAWPSVNYYTWARGSNRDEIAAKPMLRGYLYVSAPRQELLARLISDPTGYIGETPKLPEPLIDALRSVRWSSTLYIRPGLFHIEYGWPYELEIKLSKGANFGLTLQGGAVFRIEDASMLYGVAFRAQGFAQFGGKIGGDSLGASVEARADFSLDGKFIAYVSLQRASDTLFYGSLAFACTVLFRVSFWLRFRAGFITVSLSISFSVKLSISIALEAAIGPGILAGRGSARIAVSAFGRTLSLGVGFGFNQDKLEEARLRVARFLSLGLAATIPDPAQGLAAPPPAAVPRKDDRVLDEQAKKDGVLGEVDAPAKSSGQNIVVKPPCQLIGAPQFMALLFELPAMPRCYVMQLVPRDRTAIAGREHGNPLLETDSAFYAPPMMKDGQYSDDTVYEISLPADVKLVQLTGQADYPERVLSAQENLSAFNNRLVAQENGQSLRFGALFEQCFVREEMEFNAEGELLPGDGPLMEPAAEEIWVRRTKFVDRAAHDKALSEAAADMAKLSKGRAENRAVEERRSAMVAAICESAEALARAAAVSMGKVTWPERLAPVPGQSVIDARDTGLTFFVKEDPNSGSIDDTLGKLFDSAESRFGIATKLSSGDASPERPVMLQNPPSVHFDNANMVLDGLKVVAYDRSGVSLNWDLNSDDRALSHKFGDPEFRLKHYRVQRVFLDRNGVVDAIPILETTTKAASPLRAVVGDDGALAWEHVPVVAQFIDDFGDLPAAWRQAILENGEAKGLAVSTRPKAGNSAVEANWNAFISQAGIADGVVSLSYIIVPVDTSGNEGDGTPLEYTLEPSARPPTPIASASLRVVYDRLPGVSSGAVEVGLQLRLDDALFVAPGGNLSGEKGEKQQSRLPDDGTVYELRIRRERSAVMGLFGADTVGDAISRPSPQALEKASIDDVTVALKLAWQAADEEIYRYDHALDFVAIGTKPQAGAPVFILSATDLQKLRNTLGINEKGQQDKPLSVRAAIRRFSTVKEGNVARSPYISADLLMRIGEGEAKAGRRLPPPIDTVVEVFESPRVIGFKPMPFDDLAGSAGRLLVRYPPKQFSLADLIKPKPVVDRMPDGAQRVATTLTWNAIPSALRQPKTGVANLEDAFVAGHDLFEINLTAATNEDEQVSTAVNIGRVMTLDPRLANALPESIADFGAVEAFYPSERLRRQSAPAGVRHSAWFSPAESLTIWPKPLVRRSVGLGANDAELAALLAKGAPVRISVEWHKPESDVEPFGDSLDRIERLCKPAPAPAFCKAALASEEPKTNVEKPQPTDGFPIDGSPSMAIRRLLYNLMILVPEELQAAYDDPANREAFTNLEIKLTGWTAKNNRTGSVVLKVDLHQPTHAFIADVIDAMRWHDGGTTEFYRRYRPVLDAPPQTQAKTLTALLDERPVGRDPHGWAILKTLGLAQGFRLFDLRAGEFQAPFDAVKHLNEVIGEILKRYPIGQLGAPMVDLLVRPDVLYDVSSFDGGVTETAEFDQHGILPLLQLALRPMPESLADGFQYRAAAVRYFRVDLAGPKSDLAVNLALDGTKLGDDYIVELIDLSLNRSGGSVRVVVKDSAAYATKRLASGRLVETSAKFPVRLGKAEANSRTVLLLRVVGPAIAKVKEDLDKAFMVETNDIEDADQLFSIKVEDVLHPNALSNGKKADPFSRFPELDAKTIATLFFGSQETGGKIALSLGPSAAAKDQVGRFAWYASARFGAVSHPNQAGQQKQEEFAGRWPALVRRFLDHGVEDRPAQDAIAFSFATVPMPDPLRLSIPDDGVLRAVIIHTDLLARRLRYVVRPFGRYENIMAAWDAAQKDNSLRVPFAARRLLADSVGATDAVTLPQIKAVELARYSIDITVPRTQPLAPPVVLSARRLDVLPKETAGSEQSSTDARVGKLLEFVVARHSEEVISESNATTADALQFEHTAFGFSRQFAHETWLRSLKTIATHALGSDWAVEQTPYAASPESLRPPELSFKRNDFSEAYELAADGQEMARASLPDRLTDGWRGITAIRIQGVPHFYRVNANIFAAAGTVVSKAVLATVPEGYHELHWPWWDGGEDGEPPAFDERKPTWSLERSGSKEQYLRLTFSMPLIRLVDGMPVRDRELWVPSDPVAKRIFLLPDPAVAYEISLRRNIQTGGKLEIPVDVSPEIELLPFPRETGAAYLAKNLGHTLHITAPEFAVSFGKEDSGWHLSMNADAKPTSVRPALEPSTIPAWLLPKAGELQLVGDNTPPYSFAACAELWKGFAPFAPLAFVDIVIDRPNDTPAGWAQLHAEVLLLNDWAVAYQAKSEGKAKSALDAIITKIAPFLNVHDAAGWIGEVGGSDKAILAVLLPACMCELPPLSLVTCGNATGWTVEAIPAAINNGKLMDFRLSLLSMRAKTGSSLDSEAKIEALFAKPYWAAVWSVVHDRQARQDTECYADFAPLSENLQDPLRPMAASVAANLTEEQEETFQFLTHVTIEIDNDIRNMPEFRALLDVLDSAKPGHYALRSALCLLEWHGKGQISAQAPWCELSDDKPLAQALAALARLAEVKVTTGTLPEILCLRRPPNEVELKASKDACGVDGRSLFRLILDLAARQLFGAGRSPYLKALKGMHAPLLVPMQRETEI